MGLVLDKLQAVLESTWAILVEAGPWLLLGFVAAGLVRSLLPDRLLNSLLGRRGPGSVLRAAVLGTPLPLCSCGVLPAAVGLRRQGLSKSSTVSFLVATPQNGVDSIALAYAMLGPVFAVLKVVVGLVTAVAAGLLTFFVADGDGQRAHKLGGASEAGGKDCCNERAATTSCCSAGGDDEKPADAEACCEDGASDETPSLLGGQRYAFGMMLADLAPWLAIGFVVAAVIDAFVPPEALGAWGSGPVAMLGILVVSIPMYICATASLPVAASLIAAGVSPGTALVFLIAGPATNFAGIAVIRREIGTRATAAYLAGVIATSVLLGLGTDLLIARTGLELLPREATPGTIVPAWLAIPSAAVLAVLIAGHMVVRAFRRGPVQEMTTAEDLAEGEAAAAAHAH